MEERDAPNPVETTMTSPGDIPSHNVLPLDERVFPNSDHLRPNIDNIASNTATKKSVILFVEPNI